MFFRRIAAAALFAGAVGCTSIAGLDDLSFAGTGGSVSSTSSSGGGSTSSAGGMGGMGTGGDGGMGATGGTGGMGGAVESYVDVVMSDAPIAYWRLGDPDGATFAANEIMGAPDGAVVQPVVFGAPGAIQDGDTAIELDGMNGFLEAGDNFGFEGGAAFSIEAWVNPTLLEVTRHGIAGKRLGTGVSANGYMLRTHTDGTVELRMWRDGVDEVVRGLAPLPIGSFTHVVATFDGMNMRLFEDGSTVAMDTFPLQLAAVANPFTIGSDPQNGKFLGVIDEVAVYDRALLPMEVLEHYTAGTR